MTPDEFSEFLDSVQVVGHPTKTVELAELARLIRKYPDEARQIWASLTGP